MDERHRPMPTFDSKKDRPAVSDKFAIPVRPADNGNGMTLVTISRPFVPGTTGWTAADLDDPEIERLWNGGQYEIVNGVLTTMPPANFDGTAPLDALVDVVKAYFAEIDIKGRWGSETDIIINDDCVGRADMVFLTQEQIDRHATTRRAGQGRRKGMKVGRVVLPPLLVIESTSPGHERHDQVTKRRWYAEIGVEKYRIVDAFVRSLTCLRLDDGTYVEDGFGKSKQTVRPGAFDGLAIPLGDLWL
jgi:Uma2 family endonuclease